jgi:hypothetical protein
MGDASEGSDTSETEVRMEVEGGKEEEKEVISLSALRLRESSAS